VAALCQVADTEAVRWPTDSVVSMAQDRVNTTAAVKPQKGAKAMGTDKADEQEAAGLRTDATDDEDTEGHRYTAIDDKEDDTEGHKFTEKFTEKSSDPDFGSQAPSRQIYASSDEDDTEGHAKVGGH
jgi:hypothetical protein